MHELIIAVAATTRAFTLTSILPCIKAAARSAGKKKIRSGSNDKHLASSLPSLYGNESDAHTHQKDDISYASSSMSDLIVDSKRRRNSYIEPEGATVRSNRFIKRVCRVEMKSSKFKDGRLKENSKEIGDFMIYGDTTDDVDQQIDDMLAAEVLQTISEEDHGTLIKTLRKSQVQVKASPEGPYGILTGIEKFSTPTTSVQKKIYRRQELRRAVLFGIPESQTDLMEWTLG